MNKYEIMFIVKPDLEEAEIKKTAETMKKVLTDKGAKVTEEKAMGQKDLAYEMKKYKTGFYFLYTIENGKNAIDEFARVAKINENIIRHLIVKVDE